MSFLERTFAAKVASRIPRIQPSFTTSVLEAHFAQSVSKGDFAKRYLEYLGELIQAIDEQIIEEIIDTLIQAGKSGNTIYSIGNGGSAAMASHFANDLGIGTRAPGIPPFKAISLADNVAAMTSLANDEGYTNVFIRQLDGILRPGDVVVAFSVSGESPNIVEALRYAKAHGATTIGCTGFSGGSMQQFTDINLHVPTHQGEYGPVEDVFSILGHLIYTYLRLARRGGCF
jgi:D-sedoheptulose 7-phosphate isomerase